MIDKKRWPLLLFTLVLVISVVIRLLLIVQGRFDGLYGQDPYAYYNYAIGVFKDSIPTLEEPPPFFWPPGYPYLVAALSYITGLTPLAGQIISLVAGLVVPIFTYLLAKELWPLPSGHQWGPVLTGLLVALHGQLWQSSVVVMADMAGLAAATGGAWALMRYARPGSSPLWLWLAAAAIAWAVFTCWAYALVAIPLTACAIYLLQQRPKSTAVWHTGIAGSLVLIILAPLYLPLISNYFSPAGNEPSLVANLTVAGWSPLNALRRTHESADGLLQYNIPNGLYNLAAPAHRFFFTPLLAWIILPGLWVTWRRRSIPLLLLTWGWAGMVFILLAGIMWQNLRFTLAYLPPLALLAAIGVVQIWQWLGDLRLGKTARRVSRPVFISLLTAGFLWMAWGGWTLTGDFIERKQDDLAIVEWVEEKAPDDARLLTFGLTLTFQQYSDLETRELFFENPETLAGLATSDRPILLLVDVENVETQWPDRSPGINYHWLRDSLGLSVIGRRGPYTLFDVRTLGPAGEG